MSKARELSELAGAVSSDGTKVGINQAPQGSYNLSVNGTSKTGNPGLSNTGLDIHHKGGNSYGAIRFYADGTDNDATIHYFGDTWGNGSFWSESTGALNLGGLNGVTIGDWNDPDMAVDNNGEVRIKNKLLVQNQEIFKSTSIYSPFHSNSTLYGANQAHRLFYMNDFSFSDQTYIYNLRTSGIQDSNYNTSFWEPSWTFVLGYEGNNWYNATGAQVMNYNATYHHRTWGEPTITVDSDNTSGSYGRLCLYINFPNAWRAAGNFILDARRII